VAGPFAVLLHSPEVARRTAELGAFIRFESSLLPADRELVILTLARELDCRFEWAAHVPEARAAGVRAEAIAAVGTRQAPEGLTPGEAEIVRYVQELLRRHRVDEARLAPLLARLGERGLVELTATVGYYAMLACALNAFGLEPGADAAQLPA
jgi:4-carboxymuconolactone decarboxylase